jgi:hypothetical protein
MTGVDVVRVFVEVFVGHAQAAQKVMPTLM